MGVKMIGKVPKNRGSFAITINDVYLPLFAHLLAPDQAVHARKATCISDTCSLVCLPLESNIATSYFLQPPTFTCTLGPALLSRIAFLCMLCCCVCSTFSVPASSLCLLSQTTILLLPLLVICLLAIPDHLSSLTTLTFLFLEPGLAHKLSLNTGAYV